MARCTVNRLALVAACSLMAATANADPIPVNNFSFEDAGLASGGWSDCIDIECGVGTDPEFWVDDPINTNTSFAEVIDGFSSDGTHHLGVQSGELVTQDLNVPLMSNSAYVLTVSVGNRANFTAGANDTVFGFTAGGIGLGGASVNASIIPAGTFEDRSFVYFAGASPPSGDLGVYLGSAAANRAHFDNVRVDVSTGAPGDVNGDGMTNSADYSIILANMQQAVTSRAEGDLNLDGAVNFIDFRQWKAAATVGAGAAVPEPDVILLAAVAGVGLFVVRGARRATRYAPQCLGLSLYLLCLSSTAQADPIPVNNASFEDAALASGGWSDCIDIECGVGTDPEHWVDDPLNSNSAFAEAIDGFASDGFLHLGVQQGQTVRQDLGVSLLADQVYQLTVSVGNRDGFVGASNESIFGFTLDGVEVSRTTIDASNVALNAFEDFSNSYPTGAAPPAGELGVYVGSAAGGRGHFDHVRVEFNPFVIGDVTGDGLVNDTDLGVIRGNFFLTGATLSDGDVNLDGTVEWADFKLFKANASLAASGATVPEPSGLLLSVFCCLSLGALRRRDVP